MQKHHHKKDDDRGFVLPEILGGLVIIGILVPLIWRETENYLNEQIYQGAAQHAATFSTAARNYIADNNTQLLNGSLPVTVRATDLISRGYLKRGFAESPFGQTYVTGINKNAATHRLEALTCSTGGQPITEDGMRSIAAQIPGLGGYISGNGTVTGAFGGWTDNGSQYGIRCEAGHVGILMTGDDLQESDRLYRFQVNGRPDLNRMHTAIDMNGNNLSNAGTVDAVTGNFSGDVNGTNGRFRGRVSGNDASFSAGVTAGGDIRSTGGWLVTRSGKGWLNESHGGGLYMSDNDWLRSVNNKGIYTGGQIKGGTVRADGRLYTGEYLQLERTAVAGTSCAPDGLVGRDNKGGILSCQSGIWKKPGSADSQIVTASATQWRWPGATATCPAGKKVTGGGGVCSTSIGFIWLTQSVPVGDNSWHAHCDTTEDQYGKITVYAICQ